MANQSETGHAKNVANFGVLISVVTGFGPAYNPSKQSIKAGALASLAEDASDALSQYNGALGQAGLAIAARTVAFTPLSKLVTRILNSLRACDTSKQIVDAAQSLVRKIQGRRATLKKTDADKAALLAKGASVKEISSSQMSFDNRVDGFDKLIQLLSGVPQYTPNEEDLKLATLTGYYNTLKDANAAAIDAETRLSNARLVRNDILYTPELGLVDIAISVKTYVKSVFEAKSPQYKQISGLKFKSVKIITSNTNNIAPPVPIVM